ncbi:hypothetical protein NHX12_015139 [Muraenolepis orangiensis]|uniref:Uncharacterized protein n=1 Tax=Muraenolepis orangiensis TaxID=630683 RepID=A0A9Q0D9B8_9TELE|nr:hypothetical protein NHX12_015139 [Muraenolepis orangiensis]
MAEARVVLLSGDASLCSGSQQLQPPCQLRVSARLQERLLGLCPAPGEAAGSLPGSGERWPGSQEDSGRVMAGVLLCVVESQPSCLPGSFYS